MLKSETTFTPDPAVVNKLPIIATRSVFLVEVSPNSNVMDIVLNFLNSQLCWIFLSNLVYDMLCEQTEHRSSYSNSGPINFYYTSKHKVTQNYMQIQQSIRGKWNDVLRVVGPAFNNFVSLSKEETDPSVIYFLIATEDCCDPPFIEI